MTHRLYLSWLVTHREPKHYDTYECVICHSCNCQSQLHCRNCGTIPSHYSLSGMPERQGSEAISYAIPVYVAYGAMRQTSTRTIKRAARTVPADYYAEAARWNASAFTVVSVSLSNSAKLSAKR